MHQAPNLSFGFNKCGRLEERAVGPRRKMTLHFASNHRKQTQSGNVPGAGRSCNFNDGSSEKQNLAKKKE